MLRDTLDSLVRLTTRKKDKIDVRANTVRGYFKGYPFLCIAKYVDDPHHIVDWCSNNATEWNYRTFRVSPSRYSCDWDFDELGGGDLSFWAFTDEEDAVMFALQWS